MKNNKKIIISTLIICVLLLIIVFLYNYFYSDKNKINEAQNSIEKIFFYLPNNNYTDLNEISDYCKISLIYGTNYLKNDKLLSKDDYDTIVKKNGIKAYSKENINKAIKSILGSNSSINFEPDEYGDYSFLLSDNCKNGNNKIKKLSYNEEKGYVFSIGNKEENNTKLYVKWKKREYNGDYVVLHAQALLAVKNSNNDYDIYADNKLEHLVANLTEKELKYKIDFLYEYNSSDYIITLRKEKGSYIWVKYEVIDNFDSLENMAY